MVLGVVQVKDKVLPLLKEAGVVRSDLFGSVVRGEAAGESDVDILVELPKGKSLLDLIRLERKLEERLGRKVDLLTYNSLRPSLASYIRKDLRRIL